MRDPGRIFRDLDKENDIIKKVQNQMSFVREYLMIMNAEKKVANRIMLFLSLGLINGIQRIFCLLRLIDIQKRVFVLELEQGQEQNIPLLLSNDTLPASFQYYDSIIHICQNMCSKEKRQMLSLQVQLQKHFEDSHSIKNKLIRLFRSKKHAN